MNPKRFPLAFNSPEAADPQGKLTCSAITGGLHLRVVQLYVPPEFCLLDLTFDGESQMFSREPMASAVVNHFEIDANLPPNTIIEVHVQNVTQERRYCSGGILCEYVTPPADVQTIPPAARPARRRVILDAPPNAPPDEKLS